MGRRLRWTVGTLAVLLIAASAGAATFAVTRAIARPAPAATPGYAVSCPACPATPRITSVEVQPRSGSTLFVVRGTYSMSVQYTWHDLFTSGHDSGTSSGPYQALALVDAGQLRLISIAAS